MKESERESLPEPQGQLPCSQRPRFRQSLPALGTPCLCPQLRCTQQTWQRMALPGSGGRDPAGVQRDAATRLSGSPKGQRAICLNPTCSWGVAEQPLKEFFPGLNLWTAAFLEAASKTELHLPIGAESWCWEQHPLL